jgi:hypothetical protein
MKRITALAACALALAAVAGQAQAASAPDQRIAALERQVADLQRALAGPQAQSQTPADRKIAALTRRVTALEKKLKAVEKKANDAGAIGVGAFGYAVCLTAVTADAFTGAWNVVDQIAAATQAGKVYFGPQQPVNDERLCTALQITRQTSIPPSVANFSALTALLGSRYAALTAGF